MEGRTSALSRVIESFLKGNLAILLIIISLLAGVVALLVTPREEEPQIVVPLADVMVMYPGGSAEEVEKMVASRLERLLFQIDGVEYVYSMSRPGMAVVTVRFFVGQDREESLIKLYNKIYQNMDKVTPGIAGWVIKPIEIDDVPIVNITLNGKGVDDHQLYRIAEEVVAKLQHIPNSAKISIHGGRKRVVYVYLDPERLAAYGLSSMEVAGAIQISNAQMQSGDYEKANEVIRVEAGPFVKDIGEIRNLLITLHEGRPVYLRDVAEIRDGPEEVRSYSRIGFGPAHAGKGVSAMTNSTLPAVTIAVAKKKGRPCFPTTSLTESREITVKPPMTRSTAWSEVLAKPSLRSSLSLHFTWAGERAPLSPLPFPSPIHWCCFSIIFSAIPSTGLPCSHSFLLWDLWWTIPSSAWKTSTVTWPWAAGKNWRPYPLP
jgi:Cu/Ag efflux pump CusA